MARSLTVSRAAVPAGSLDRYRSELIKLQRAVEARGARFWAFRSASSPDTYLEFVESAAESAGARTKAELVIEERLRALAVYGPDAEELWIEFQP